MRHCFAHSDSGPPGHRSDAEGLDAGQSAEEFSTSHQKANMPDLHLDEIDRLIDHSSLGAPDVKSLRNRTPADSVRQILDRAKSLDRGRFAVGVEILPCELVGVLTDHKGTVCGARRWLLPSMDVDAVVDRVAKAVKDLVATSLGLDLPNPQIGVGLQLGGLVDTRTGMVIFYSNHPTDPANRRRDTQYLSWDQEKLAERVEAATGCRTVLENDAVAYTVYEQKFGVGQEVASFAVVLVRDGVGCGLVVDNKLVPSPLEFGHIVVWPDGRECDCGNRGCLETQAGRRAIRAVVGELTGRPADLEWGAAVKLAQGEDDQADKALSAFRLAGEAVARGIATLLTLHHPARVAIYGPKELLGSGKGNQAADVFVEQTEKFWQYVFPPLRRLRRCELVSRPLRPTDGAHGAALIALHRLQ